MHTIVIAQLVGCFLRVFIDNCVNRFDLVTSVEK